MATAPSASFSASACAPRPATAAGNDEKTALCEDCGADPRVAVVFCTVCRVVYCVECDAAAHVRARKDHPRVPISERPVLCSLHSKEVEAYCEQEERLACLLCITPLPPGVCVPHLASVKPIAEAATSARAKLAQLTSSFASYEMKMNKEVISLTALRGAIDERIHNLNTSLAHARMAQTTLTIAQTLNNVKILQQINSLSEQAGSVWKAMVCGSVEWQTKWRELIDTAEACAAEQPVPLPTFAALAMARACAGAQAVRGPPIQVPNLDALSPPRTIPNTAFKNPWMISEAHDASSPSVIVADQSKGALTWQVWLNNSQPPQQLPPATADASCVLPLTQHEHGGDGYLIVSCVESRVERIGSITWKRTAMKSPYACVVVGVTALVTECDGGQVTRLDMRSGNTIDIIGKGILKGPRGIAVNGATGDIVVVHNNDGDSNVQVFDSNGLHLRTLNRGLLKNPFGVCVDGIGRVYVADYDAKAIAVFDGVSGTHLKSIAVEGVHPVGVCVTHQGQIIVSLQLHNGLRAGRAGRAVRLRTGVGVTVAVFESQSSL